MKEQIWQDAYDKLKQENKELKDKLNHIKMVGYGNYKSIEKDIKEHFQNNELICIDDILHIIDNEIEKTGNLCTMCDGVNMYVKYEATLRELDNILQGMKGNDSLEPLRKLIANAFNAPTSEEAVKKAHSEFEKYDNKTSL